MERDIQRTNKKKAISKIMNSTHKKVMITLFGESILRIASQKWHCMATEGTVNSHLKDFLNEIMFLFAQIDHYVVIIRSFSIHSI